MQFKRYTDVHAFYDETYDIFMRHEAQNIIPLGNLLIGYAGVDKTGWRDPKDWLMATVMDGSQVILSAIMTPPHNLTLYATDNKINKAAIDCLIDNLKGENIPGVMTEKGLAEAFRDAYVKTNGLSHKIAQSQRIYELTEVNQSLPKIGTLQLLEEKDMGFFPYWLEAFRSSIEISWIANSPTPSDNEADYHYHIEKKYIYILEDNGVPVSMAGISRRMENTCAIGYVYTPPYFRGRGYATGVVSGISQIALDSGLKSCALYTDLANPTSNSIYQKIGYRELCDSLVVRFE